MEWKLDWPQITFFALFFVTALIQAHDHGKPKKGYYSFWTSIMAMSLESWILYAGGFFTK